MHKHFFLSFADEDSTTDKKHKIGQQWVHVDMTVCESGYKGQIVDAVQSAAFAQFAVRSWHSIGYRK